MTSVEEIRPAPPSPGMARAVAAADEVRWSTSPNPWVGCIIVSPDGSTHEGATEPPGSRHAERVALDRAGPGARGSTAYVTLEPCAHQGRTPPCSDALIEAGVARVVVGVEDPDPSVSGRGIERLRDAGVEVVLGDGADEVRRQLAPYLCHRSTGRPYVVLKLAATVDGRTAAPDGSSRWITGPEARVDVHRLRAESDAVLVGAVTVRVDDPSLTVRDWTPTRPIPGAQLQPLRVVLGSAPADAAVQPALEVSGDLTDVLDQLGAKGVVQLLVEGGPTTAAAFHCAGLVDLYVVYVAPGLFGGDDARPLFTGPGAATIGDLWRGRFDAITALGADVRIDLVRDGRN